MTMNLRIAVADDELDMRDYFARLLPRLGHQVVCIAENGRQLVDFCRQDFPDLIVTDIRMPEMDGIEAAAVLQNIRPVPVVLVSAFHDPQTMQRAQDDRVLAYLVKPIKQADLQAAITVVKRRFDERNARRQADGFVAVEPMLVLHGSASGRGPIG